MSFTYKGLEATYTRHQVTDEEVNLQMERLRQQTPKITPVVGRAAARGDTVELDYAGFCKGEQFEGGSAEHQTLVLGSGTFIPGFEEQLIGCRPGEQVTVKVTFPQQYHAPQLAGQAAEFRCTIHRIFQQTAHSLDDAFAQALGLRDMAHLRQDLRESLQYYADERGELDLEDRLIRQAAGSLDFHPTAQQLEEALEEQMETLRAQLAQQNLTMEMYCRFSGKSEEELREDTRPEAEQILRVRTAIDEIARLEKVEVEEQDVADSLAEICKRNHITMDQLRASYDEKFASAVERNIRMRKVMRLVRQLAVVHEET